MNLIIEHKSSFRREGWRGSVLELVVSRSATVECLDVWFSSVSSVSTGNLLAQVLLLLPVSHIQCVAIIHIAGNECNVQSCLEYCHVQLDGERTTSVSLWRSFMYSYLLSPAATSPIQNMKKAKKSCGCPPMSLSHAGSFSLRTHVSDSRGAQLSRCIQGT